MKAFLTVVLFLSFLPSGFSYDDLIREAERACMGALVPWTAWVKLGSVVVRRGHSQRAYRAFSRGISQHVRSKRQLLQTPGEAASELRTIAETGKFKQTDAFRIPRCHAADINNFGAFGAVMDEPASALWCQLNDDQVRIVQLDGSRKTRLIKGKLLTELSSSTLLVAENQMEYDSATVRELFADGHFGQRQKLTRDRWANHDGWAGNEGIEADGDGLIFVHSVNRYAAPHDFRNPDRVHPVFEDIDFSNGQGVYATSGENSEWIVVGKAQSSKLSGLNKGQMVQSKRIMGRNATNRKMLYSHDRPRGDFYDPPLLFPEGNRAVWSSSEHSSLILRPLFTVKGEPVAFTVQGDPNRHSTTVYKNPIGMVLQVFSESETGPENQSWYRGYDLDGARLLNANGSPSFSELDGVDTAAIEIFPDGRILFSVNQLRDYPEDEQTNLFKPEIRARGRFQIYSSDGRFLEALPLDITTREGAACDTLDSSVRVFRDGRIGVLGGGNICIFEWQAERHTDP